MKKKTNTENKISVLMWSDGIREKDIEAGLTKLRGHEELHGTNAFTILGNL